MSHTPVSQPEATQTTGTNRRLWLDVIAIVTSVVAVTISAFGVWSSCESEAAVRDVEDAVKLNTAEVGDVEQANERTEKAVREVRETVGRVEDAVGENTKEVRAVRQANEQTADAVHVVRGELGQVEAAVGEVEDAVGENTNEVSAVRQANEQTAEAVREVKGDLGEIEAAVGEVEDAIGRNTVAVGEVKLANDRTTAAVTLNSAAVSEVESAVREVKVALSGLMVGTLYRFDPLNPVYWVSGFDEQGRALLLHVTEELFETAGCKHDRHVRVIADTAALQYAIHGEATARDLGEFCSSR